MSGKSIGKSFAPNYASIFLHFWESEFIKSQSLKPNFWVRYIDDIFGIWVHGLSSLNTFLLQLNNFYDSMNITFKHSFQSIDFLDISIFKHADFHCTHKLCTRIYFKETFTGHLLHRHSLHPNKFKISVIKAQFLRIPYITVYRSPPCISRPP